MFIKVRKDTAIFSNFQEICNFLKKNINSAL